MPVSDRDIAGLVAALRADVPSESERERMRLRLMAAGVAVGSLGFPKASVEAAGSLESGPAMQLTAAAVDARHASARLFTKLGGQSATGKLIVAGLCIAAGGAAFWQIQQALPPARVQFELPAGSVDSARSRDERIDTGPLRPVVSADAGIALGSAESMSASGIRAASPHRSHPRRQVRAAADQGRAHGQTAAPAVLRGSAAQGGEATAPETLLAETQLLERALAELQRGDVRAALEALRSHAQRFPHGALARERERTRARALAVQSPTFQQPRRGAP
jgi:hypothetical protein